MKQISLFLLILVNLLSCRQSDNIFHTEQWSGTIPTDTSDMTNNFYDNTETLKLKVEEIIVEGEIENRGGVVLKDLPVRSVIVKETLLDSSGGDRFVGAYRYDGYSLFDILNSRIVKKDSSNKFNPVIDLYVEIENIEGEKVVFSWGEIYYPNNLHKIILATSVSRIVPSKSKNLWIMPESCKVVAGCDLVTERNISDPVKITVKSIRRSNIETRGMSPLYSSEFILTGGDKKLGTISYSDEKENVTYNTIFYGRGKGIHSTLPFTGLFLKDIIGKYFPVSRRNLQSGLFCIAGKDGYHCAVSYSELFNRNDQQEFLLVRTEPDEDGGLYRVFAACDFFSDRAIKSVTEIQLFLPDLYFQ